MTSSNVPNSTVSPSSNMPSSNMPSSNMIKQSIKYVLLSLVMLTSIMYVPQLRMSILETAFIIVVSVGALIVMDHWCPSVRYCLRNMDACINHDDALHL